jgi:antitoxin ParD1/3/4
VADAQSAGLSLQLSADIVSCQDTHMTFSVTPEQLAWINARVARGDFASAEEAARQLIDERIAERVLEEQDDLVRAGRHVDEALTAVARGHVISRGEHRFRDVARLAGFGECDERGGILAALRRSPLVGEQVPKRSHLA